jgi:acyl-CoA synthetase (AMP-forming)/AMP-acid ligase II/acyl carrier protein
MITRPHGKQQSHGEATNLIMILSDPAISNNRIGTRLTEDPSRTTIGQAIRMQTESQPDHPAVLCSGRAPLSYRGLQRIIDEIRLNLRMAGFTRSARIVIAFPTGPHAALAIIGVACAAVAIPLDPRLTLAEIEKRVTVLRPDAVILLQGADSAARRVAERNGIAIVEATPSNAETIGLKIFAPPAPRTAPADRPEPDAPAFILQTSGTTADAMSIPFGHRNMLAAAARMKTWFALTPQDRCLCVSPVYYSHGLKVTCLTPILTGGTVAFPADPSRCDLSEWFGTLEPTWYSAAPTLHRRVLDRVSAGSTPRVAHSLRFVLSGGAPLPREIHQGLERGLGVPVVEHYGTSEAAQIAANTPPPGRSRPGTCGVPWPDTVVIADDDGNALPAGEQGEILVRGATVMPGYLDAPELNRYSFRDGWLKTGDIGSLDAEGFLTLHGRKKDLINRGGEKVWPIEIDSALMRHPAVAEGAAFGVSHARLGEEVAAAVELKPGMTLTAPELRAYLSEQLAPFKVPRRILFVDQLPKGLTGKVLRRRLVEMFDVPEPLSASVPDGPGPDSLSSQLTKVWERLLKVSPVGIDDDFFGMGGDSLLAVELLAELERLTGRKIPGSVLFEASTVRQLTRKLSEKDSLPSGPVSEIASRGSNPPLIYFHGDPSGGSYVRKLTALLGSNQPLLVVGPHGFDNQPVPPSLEAMAADRLPSIIEAQPDGPYRLAGYCIGGLVAFEVARLLVAAGKKVELVVMIDSPTVNARPSARALLSALRRLRPGEGSRAEAAVARDWYNLTRIDKFFHFSFSEQWARGRAKLQSRLRPGHRVRTIGGSAIGGSAISGPRTTNHAGDQHSAPTVFRQMPFSSYFWKYSVAMSKYLPRPLGVRVLYFSADYAGKPWRRISTDLEVIRLSGGHYGVPTDPSDLARHLQLRLPGQKDLSIAAGAAV